jgi:hypothetical protein
VAVLALIGGVGLVLVGRRATFGRYARGGVALLGLLAFLVMGEMRDGAPTHHAERALFAIWLFAALFAADALFELGSAPHHRLRLAVISSVLLGLAAFMVRPWYARRDSFIDRANEIELGRAAKEAAIADERLAIDHPDFGFYALISGFGAPERAFAIDDHDPRAKRVDTSSPEALREVVTRERATLVVLQKSHRDSLTGDVLLERGGFVLLRMR